ncbi:MAG: hypothetical protein OXI63_24055 [Candidatus Poribacteria bacterium]|nr:hypothetical protein [Candidatus Poribacteria bacterium]
MVHHVIKIPGSTEEYPDKKRIVVQEGITDPERFSFHLVKTFKFLPKWFAGTSAS